MVRANRSEDDDLDRITRTLEALLWAGGKAGAKADFFTTLIEARPDDPLYRPLRLAALYALTAGPVPAAAVSLLESLAAGPDAAVRVAAAEALARSQPKKAAGVAEKALSDPDRIQPAGGPAGRSGRGRAEEGGRRPALPGGGPATPDRPQGL